MHILFVSDNFPPEVNAPASRTYEHAKEWVGLGHSVTIVTCVPNFPKGRVFDGYKNRLWQTADAEGIRVIRVWSYITANEGIFKRIADHISFMVTSFIASFFIRRVDLVIGTSPQFFAAISAFLISALRGLPFVFEVRDLWPESIRAVGAIRRSLFLDFAEKVELFLYKRADLIIPVTKAMRQNLIKRGVDGKKIKVVTNGVNLDRFNPTPKDDQLIAKLGLENKFIAGYIGTHGMAHALEAVIEAASLTQVSEGGAQIHYLFVGEGAEKVKLQRLVESLGLHNVTFIGSVSKSEVTKYWSILDVAIIHLKKTALFKTVIPSKLFECMGMGVPVLHAVEGESAEIVADTGVGILVVPEDSGAIAVNLVNLKNDKQALLSMSVNGVRAAKDFDRVQLAREMLRLLSDLKY